MTFPGRSVRILSVASLTLLLGLTCATHFAFFKVDRRPAIDHDSYYYRTTIPLYRSLQKHGISREFLGVPFSRFLQNTPFSTYPPLQPMLLAILFHFTGPSLFLFKMSNLVFFLLIIYAGYLIGNRVAGRVAGLFSAFLLASLPAMTHHSRKSGIFFHENAFFLLAVYFLLASENFTRRKYSLGFGICCLAMLLTHYLGLVHLAVFVLFYLATGGFSFQKKLNGLLVLAVCSLAAPWYFNYLHGYIGEKVVHSYPNIIHSPVLNMLYLLVPKRPDFTFPVYFVLLHAVIPVAGFAVFKYRHSDFGRLFLLFVLIVAFSVPVFFVFRVANSGLAMITLTAVIAAGSAVLFFREPGWFMKPLGIILGTVVLFNGILLVLWPLLRPCGVPVEAGTVTRRLEKALFGAPPPVYFQALGNYIFPMCDQADTLEEAIRYFKDIPDTGKPLRCCTVNLDQSLSDFAYNGFLRGLDIEMIDNPAQSRDYEYCIFLADAKNTLSVKGGDFYLVYNDRLKKGEAVIKGFSIVKETPVHWLRFRQDKMMTGTLYILAKTLKEDR